MSVACDVGVKVSSAETAGSAGQCETRIQSKAQDTVDENIFQREAELLSVAWQNIEVGISNPHHLIEHRCVQNMFVSRMKVKR